MTFAQLYCKYTILLFGDKEEHEVAWCIDDNDLQLVIEENQSMQMIAVLDTEFYTHNHCINLDELPYNSQLPLINGHPEIRYYAKLNRQSA